MATSPSSSYADCIATSLRQTRENLMKLPDAITSFSDQTLAEVGVHRAPQLNIDDVSAAYDWPVFFQPPEDSPRLRQAVHEEAKLTGQYSVCQHSEKHADRLLCAQTCLFWFDRAGLAASPEDQPRWNQMVSYPQGNLPRYFGRAEYVKKHGRLPLLPAPEWATMSTFIWSVETNLPHVACSVVDNKSHDLTPDEALRSEIVSALYFIQKRVGFSKDASKSIPVLVCSIYHNDTARITQMWWDVEKKAVFFRQSRILRIGSGSADAADVMLLVRWKAAFPLSEPKQTLAPLPAMMDDTVFSMGDLADMIG